MQIVNTASIKYHQILPDGSKKELNKSSNLVETTLLPLTPSTKPKITYYTPQNIRQSTSATANNLQYFLIISWLFFGNRF